MTLMESDNSEGTMTEESSDAGSTGDTDNPGDTNDIVDPVRNGCGNHPVKPGKEQNYC